MTSAKRLYLIGGSSAAGKTSTARLLRRQLRCGWLQADTVWKAAWATLPQGSPEREHLEVDEAIRRGKHSPEELTRRHIAAGAVVCRALEAAVYFELRTTYDTLVVDGSWLLPGWMAGLRFPGLNVDGRPVIIHEPDAAEVKRAMRARSPFANTLPRQALGAAVSALYGNWLRTEALEHGIPVVDARPRESLFERVTDALGLDGSV